MTGRFDEARLKALIAESQDLQADALADARRVLPDVRDLAADKRRGGEEEDPARRAAFEADRRAMMRRAGLAVAALGGAGIALGGFRGALLSALRPLVAGAQTQGDTNVDVQILQTAASLENLAVATYKAALGLPFIANGNAVVKTFAMTTMEQHSQHGKAFNAQATGLGGKGQTGPNPVLAPTVEQAKPGLKTPGDVVKLAAMLETVATETYLANLTQLGGKDVRLLMASVMGVEAQHLATLRAVGALLDGGAPQLIAIPTDPAALPAAAGSVAFPKPFEPKDEARAPREGAVA